ncbi:hypothetical protein ACM25O_16285 [Sulfitobacter pontiacus]
MIKFVQFVKTAKETLGAQGLVDATDAAEFLTDITGPGLSCLFVARPSNTEQVARIVSLCYENGVAILLQGATAMYAKWLSRPRTNQRFFCRCPG